MKLELTPKNAKRPSCPVCGGNYEITIVDDGIPFEESLGVLVYHVPILLELKCTACDWRMGAILDGARFDVETRKLLSGEFLPPGALTTPCIPGRSTPTW